MVVHPLFLLLLPLLIFISSSTFASSAVRITTSLTDLPDDYILAELIEPTSPSSLSESRASHIAQWSDYLLASNGLLETETTQSEPNKHPYFLAPDQRGTPSYGGYATQTKYDYEPIRIGKVLPNDLTHLTEGYRPQLHGYFQQSAECDQFLRMWMDTCAFKKEAKNVYHAGPKPFFLKGKDKGHKSTSTYLKGVMTKWEANHAMVLSAKQFKGKKKSAKEVPPVTFDKQT